MKSKIGLLTSLLIACSSLAQTNTNLSYIRWICSTEKSPWQEKVMTNAAAPEAGVSIKLDSNEK